MAEITIEFDLECSRCGEDLEIKRNNHYSTRQIEPCDCMLDEIDNLKQKIKELEEKIESTI